MDKHRAVIIGAGRIGAGYNWHDDEYTHAGAYRALKDRVELVGFVEPSVERCAAAEKKWGKSVFALLEDALANLQPDMVSVCVQPEQQQDVFNKLFAGDGYGIEGIWCEKPFTVKDDCDRGISCLTMGVPVQVNYIRRADVFHQVLRHLDLRHAKLTIWAKGDIHTKCHFDDLARFWGVRNVSYQVIDGPCSYQLEVGDRVIKFNSGGANGGECMKRMLQNLLDSIEGRDTLWSSP